MEVMNDLTSAICQNIGKSFKKCSRKAERLTEAVSGFVDIEGLTKYFYKVL